MVGFVMGQLSLPSRNTFREVRQKEMHVRDTDREGYSILVKGDKNKTDRNNRVRPKSSISENRNRIPPLPDIFGREGLR